MTLFFKIIKHVFFQISVSLSQPFGNKVKYKCTVKSECCCQLTVRNPVNTFIVQAFAISLSESLAKPVAPHLNECSDSKCSPFQQSFIFRNHKNVIFLQLR